METGILDRKIKIRTDQDYFPSEKKRAKSGNSVQCLCRALVKTKNKLTLCLSRDVNLCGAHLDILSPPDVRRVPSRCLLMNQCRHEGKPRAAARNAADEERAAAAGAYYIYTVANLFLQAFFSTVYTGASINHPVPQAVF